ncbi:4'-phosphopantetheinyl transferase family protein [Solihabitans fulvus]|uniref:4'-phosphopantetheinyl transferase family protein n=1 Tax=Solihabitans fulvus TaxID=1892852 RepID=UPI001661D90C|nr:4'-phosphopantetheinyl transferase superfamily protein [Solihabitans fulvus]
MTACGRVRVAVRRRSASRADARAVLRDLLADATEVAGDAEIATRPSGQPHLPAHPEISVSLSDDGDWLAAAVGVGGRVGVDVQRPEPVTAGRLRRCGSPTARVALAALPDPEREREYSRIWTVQEACVKATGTGLAGRPWTIPVEVGQHDGTWHSLCWHSVPLPDIAVSVAHELRYPEREAR